MFAFTVPFAAVRVLAYLSAQALPSELRENVEELIMHSNLHRWALSVILNTFATLSVNSMKDLASSDGKQDCLGYSRYPSQAQGDSLISFVRGLWQASGLFNTPLTCSLFR